MKNIEKTAYLLPKTSKMLQIRLSHASMIHYAWQNRGLSRRMRGIMAWQGKRSVEEEKWRVATKDYGRKNTLRHECPNTYHGQDNWPTENKKTKVSGAFLLYCLQFALSLQRHSGRPGTHLPYTLIIYVYIAGMSLGRKWLPADVDDSCPSHSM